MSKAHRPTGSRIGCFHGCLLERYKGETGPYGLKLPVETLAFREAFTEPSRSPRFLGEEERVAGPFLPGKTRGGVFTVLSQRVAFMSEMSLSEES